MSLMDLDPHTSQTLGRVLVIVGIVAILVGAVGTAIIALSPVETDGATPQQDLGFGLTCCLGPALLAGVISIVAGRSLRKHGEEQDMGSLYRGGR